MKPALNKELTDFTKMKHKMEDLTKEFNAKLKEEIKKIRIEFQAKLSRIKQEAMEENAKDKKKWDEEKMLLNDDLKWCKKIIDELEKKTDSETQIVRTRLEELEAKEEKRVLNEKRNSIVIIGANFEKNQKEKKSEVRKMINNMLKIDVQVKTAYKVSEDKMGGDIVVAEIATFKEKSRVMKNKSLLRRAEDRIFINNWLSKKQRENLKEKMRSRSKEVAQNGEEKEEVQMEKSQDSPEINNSSVLDDKLNLLCAIVNEMGFASRRK